MQAQKLLERPSVHHQSWELELLNVVQWQFLEQQKLTASALPVWPQSRVFVGLNTHFPLLSCSPVLPKNEETRFTNSFIRTHQILISPANEMKWNELYGLQLQMKWNEMKCDWFFIKETWNEVHEMHLFHEISWDFMRQKRVPQWNESPAVFQGFDLITLFATELKKGESRGGKNCHAETMMNTKSW
jgi:hypothetical protein